MKTRSRETPAGGGPRNAALVMARVLAALEWAGLALFGEGVGGLPKIFREIQLQRGGLHCNLALELVHIPAAGAHRRAYRERRVLRDFGGQLVGDFEVAAFRRNAVDDAGGESFLGGEETAGQGDVGREGSGV